MWLPEDFYLSPFKYKLYCKLCALQFNTKLVFNMHLSIVHKQDEENDEIHETEETVLEQKWKFRQQHQMKRKCQNPSS